MTLALSIISLVSLATTGALLIYVARLLRDERDRTEARVAALSVAIWREEVRPDGSEAFDYGFARQSDSSARTDDTEAPHDVLRLEAVPLSSAAFTGGGARDLFADSVAHERSEGARRWVTPVAGILIVAAVVAAGTLATKGSETTPRAATAAERLHDAPLQLLSLRHERDGEALTVSGVVRNPRGAHAQQHTDVVVFTFDRAGTFITSVRAALADPSLAGGAESPFSVTIPKGASVSRYRISFRTGSRLLPHVDRRQDAASSPGDAPPQTRGADDRTVRSTP